MSKSGTEATRDAYTAESWEEAFDEAMLFRDWQTCEMLLAKRGSETWWPARRAEYAAMPDPPGAGWTE